MIKQILILLTFGINNLLVAQNDTCSRDFTLGEALPDGIPKIFKKDVISLKESNEHTCSFSPDGNTIYFTRDPDRKIFVMKKYNNTWGSPVPTDLKGREAIFSPDGSKMFFGDGDIWFIENKEGQWTLPQKLDSNINTTSYEFYASVTNDGTMYFSRFENKHPSIFMSKRKNGHYLEAIKLPSPINLDSSNNFHPFISPKGDYLLFNSDRVGGFGDADLYISFMDMDGNWKKPMNLGSKINTELRDICPTITPDGRYLFFTRNWQESGKWYGDIYWVETFFLNVKERINSN